MNNSHKASLQLADISLVMPCYNEEEIIGYTIPKLLDAFEKAGVRLELIAVDNGSSDQTGAIIKQFAATNPGGSSPSSRAE